MSRLIDADVLIEHQPIAFNAERVIKQLEEEKDEYYKRMDEYGRKNKQKCSNIS